MSPGSREGGNRLDSTVHDSIDSTQYVRKVLLSSRGKLEVGIVPSFLLNSKVLLSGIDHPNQPDPDEAREVHVPFSGLAARDSFARKITLFIVADDLSNAILQ